MIDRPEASRLLRAMAETLSEEVVPATDGAARHSARVVANLCRILEREFESGREASETTRRALAQLLERDGTLAELAEALDQTLRDDTSPSETTSEATSEATIGTTSKARFEADAHAVLLADVRRRLAIDKPGYDR